MERYGGLLAEYKLEGESLGIHKAVNFLFLKFVSEFLIIMMIMYMQKVPTLAVLLLMYFIPV